MAITSSCIVGIKRRNSKYSLLDRVRFRVICSYLKMIFLKILVSISFVCCGFARRVDYKNGSNYEDFSSGENAKSACHYSDPKVADCIQRVVEQARHLLAQGVPSMNIQPLEPLKIPSIRLRQQNMPKHSFKYDAWLSDVTLEGLTNYTFNKLDVYPEELKVTGNISLPHLLMSGDYVVLGEFQMLPVESTGKMWANFTVCTVALEALGARVHKRLVIRDATVRLRCTGPISAEHMEAHSTSEEMEMITDHIAKMHSYEIAMEVQPAVETALAMVLEDVANKFLKHIPPEMVFPN